MMLQSGSCDTSSERSTWELGRRRLVDLATVTYTFGGYAFALYLVTRHGWLVPSAGALLMVHTMILSALLTHECMHETMAKSAALNAWLGKAMTLVSGACYVPYALLKKQHLDHHRNRVGYDGFSLTRWVAQLPAPLRQLTIGLEYMYFPVLSIAARIRSLAVPLIEPRHRRLKARIGTVLILRASGYGILFWVSPWSWLWIFSAYLGMLTILRIYDCFHHTFDVIALGAPMPQLDREYEQRNTYSSLLSAKRPWLNGIFLNYGYHNAHHARPRAHWSELPRIDEALYPATRAHCIYFNELLRWYHRHRTARVVNGLGRPEVSGGRLLMDHYYGIIMNISFIVYDV
ncbi:fatty acid desaturase [Trinickia sp. LjRoot230]|uniref:fatty acid desaturase family protein n=1 Tax=Trinickia sp. LjRoot230 TaxID=3342288 RepID=UPI003ECFF644